MITTLAYSIFSLFVSHGFLGSNLQTWAIPLCIAFAVGTDIGSYFVMQSDFASLIFATANILRVGFFSTWLARFICVCLEFFNFDISVSEPFLKFVISLVFSPISVGFIIFGLFNVLSTFGFLLMIPFGFLEVILIIVLGPLFFIGIALHLLCIVNILCSLFFNTTLTGPQFSELLFSFYARLGKFAIGFSGMDVDSVVAGIISCLVWLRAAVSFPVELWIYMAEGVDPVFNTWIPVHFKCMNTRVYLSLTIFFSLMCTGATVGYIAMMSIACCFFSGYTLLLSYGFSSAEHFVVLFSFLPFHFPTESVLFYCSQRVLRAWSNLIIFTGEVFLSPPIISSLQSRGEPTDDQVHDVLALFSGSFEFGFVFILWLGGFLALRSLLVLGKITKGITMGVYRFLLIVLLSLTPFVIPTPFLVIFEAGVAYLLLRFRTFLFSIWPEITRWARLLSIAGVINSNMPSFKSLPIDERKRLHSLFFRTSLSLARNTVTRILYFTDNLQLPEFVQAEYMPPTLDSIRNTYIFLKEDVGLNISQQFLDSIESPTDTSYLSKWGGFSYHVLGRSAAFSGFPKVKIGGTLVSDTLFPDVPGYIHSATFTSVEAVVSSISRYFSHDGAMDYVDNVDEAVDDLWYAVWPQYENSRLASFKEIYHGWVKRFNTGVGFGTFVGGKWRQSKRWETIQHVGGKEKFLKIMHYIFRFATGLTLPAPFFTKHETLKFKAFINRKIRTPVGSALTHDIMTKVFNYHPNHNFKVDVTPMKVGMSSNGFAYDRIWRSAAGFTNVFAGDMSLFDSSQRRFVLQVCAGIRKKGYTMHKDFHKICEIIDIAYEQLLRQPLASKEFGDILTKEQGFSTGHSSTSADNSLALTLNYLIAWRRVTGLRAREFFNFNSLSCFGDDHILGYDSVMGWSPEAAMVAMKEMGTIMRDEAPGQRSLPRMSRQFLPEMDDERNLPLSFLAKKPLSLSPEIIAELQNANVDYTRLAFATCHDPVRLKGKLKGQILKAKKGEDKITFDRLRSYTFLCAHNHEIYKEIVTDAQPFLYRYKASLKEKALLDPKRYSLPSYNEVLRAWYDDKGHIVDEYSEEKVLDGDVYLNVQPDVFGVLVRWFSDFPTLISARYVNIRWADWLQHRLAESLSWPLTFIGIANSKQYDLHSSRLLLSRTPYSFLRSEHINFNRQPFGNLWLKHFLFTVITSTWSRKRSFSILDLVRTLDHGWINIVFTFTGQIISTVAELDLHILETILIVLLDYFVTFSLPWFSFKFEIPSISLAFGLLVSKLISLVAPSGSIDFQSLDEQIACLSLSANSSFILSAPTGVGKSTKMVQRIALLSKRRVIVILPRHVLVTSIVPYMRSIFPYFGISGQTEGMKLDPTSRIIYTTAQSFFGNPLLRDPENIVILDEAHVDEPVYHVVLNYLRETGSRMIAMTATPPDTLKDLPTLKIPSVSTFTVDKIETEISNKTTYLREVASFINDRTVFEKQLVFVPFIKDMHVLASLIRHKCTFISSKHPSFDPDAVVFISTSVSDAGLTIPDVKFVHSMNFDFTLSGSDELAPREEGLVKSPQRFVPYFFPLDANCITQRAGRTGRTCDGVFFLYKVKDMLVREKFFTIIDYLRGCSPFAEAMYHYFPQKVKSSMSDELYESLFLWDYLPAWSWQGFSNTIRLWEQKAPDTPFGDFLHAVAPRLKSTFPVFGYEDLTDPEKKPTDLFEKMNSEDTEEFYDAHETLEMVPLDLNTVFKRCDVPSSGLYCGLFCVMGLIRSHFNRQVPFSEIYAHAIALTPTDLLEDYSRNFTPDLLIGVGAQFGLRIAVIDDSGRFWNMRVEGDLVDCLVYHTGNEHGGHYNYHGLEFERSFFTADF